MTGRFIMQNQRGWRLAILAYQSIGVVSVYASEFSTLLIFYPSMLALSLHLGHDLSSVTCALCMYTRSVRQSPLMQVYGGLGENTELPLSCC